MILDSWQLRLDDFWEAAPGKDATTLGVELECLVESGSPAGHAAFERASLHDYLGEIDFVSLVQAFSAVPDDEAQPVRDLCHRLTDRLTREPGFPVGHVIDFISTPWLLPAIYNIADIAIVGGMALFIVLVLCGVPVNGVKESVAAADPQDDAEMNEH